MIKKNTSKLWNVLVQVEMSHLLLVQSSSAQQGSPIETDNDGTARFSPVTHQFYIHIFWDVAPGRRSEGVWDLWLPLLTAK